MISPSRLDRQLSRDFLFLIKVVAVVVDVRMFYKKTFYVDSLLEVFVSKQIRHLSLEFFSEDLSSSREKGLVKNRVYEF